MNGVRDQKRRSRKEGSPFKLRKSSGQLSLEKIRAKNLKNFENPKEILVTHYDDQQILDSDYYKLLFEFQVI